MPHHKLGIWKTYHNRRKKNENSLAIFNIHCSLPTNNILYCIYNNKWIRNAFICQSSKKKLCSRWTAVLTWGKTYKQWLTIVRLIKDVAKSPENGMFSHNDNCNVSHQFTVCLSSFSHHLRSNRLENVCVCVINGNFLNYCPHILRWFSDLSLAVSKSNFIIITW